MQILLVLYDFKSCAAEEERGDIGYFWNKLIKDGGGNIARAAAVPSQSKDVYVCKRCGYVLPKEEAVVSGWDAEHSQTHVHRPNCGKIIARYVK